MAESESIWLLSLLAALRTRTPALMRAHHQRGGEEEQEATRRSQLVLALFYSFSHCDHYYHYYRCMHLPESSSSFELGQRDVPPHCD